MHKVCPTTPKQSPTFEHYSLYNYVVLAQEYELLTQNLKPVGGQDGSNEHTCTGDN